MDALLCDLASDGFGYWLAGWIDGEGSFQIVPNRPGYRCRFGVGLRSDDLPVLRLAMERTGIGRIVRQTRNVSASPATKPLAHWRVERDSETRVLVAILDAFPLLSKKSRDFAVWKRAVAAVEAMPPPNGRPRDWSALVSLKQELADARAYREFLLDPGVAGGS